MKRLALAVLVVLVSACATYPPPKIENNGEAYCNRGGAKNGFEAMGM